MDRRSFLRTASAAGLMPLLPALPAAPAAAAAVPVVNDFMYGLAVFNARLRGVSSPDKICRDLGLGKDAATALQSRLVQDGFVGLPSASGLARTKEPFAQTLDLRRKTTQKLRELAQDKLTKVKDELLEGEFEDDASDEAQLTDQALTPEQP